MELDTIKAAWQSLDDRLRKQESIKETILKELIQSKGNRALSKLYNYEWFGLLLTILVSPLIPYFVYKMYDKLDAFSTILVFALGGCVLGTIGGQIWKIITLNKIDFTRKIRDNIQVLNRYNLYIKKEKSLTYIILILLVIYFINCNYIEGNIMEGTNTFLYVFILIIVGLMSQWIYKAIYNKNIDSIQKSLDELKELEEE